MTENEEKNKKSPERSVAYPSLTLEKAIELAAKLRTALGKTPYSREEAAKALDYSGISGASTRTVAALTHYGLLDRSGNTYSTSELTEEIIHPTDETGKLRKEAIIKAARNPKLFDKLITKFQNQSLPTLLENIIMREGVSSKSAKEVANTFKETLRYAEILINGVVKVEPIDNVDTKLQSSQQKNQGGFELADNFFGFPNKKEVTSQTHTHNESGHGWNLTIRTNAPLTSEIKRKLIDVTELLDKVNKNQ